MLLFTAAVGFFAANNQFGIRLGVMLRDAERDYRRDLLNAKPIPRLVAHHSWVTYYYHDRLADYLRQLRDAGIAPYDRLPSDPSFRARALCAAPNVVHEIDWQGDGGRILGPDAYLRYDLDKPEFTSGLRFRISLVDPSGMLPAMRVRWQSDTKPGLQQYICRYGSTTGEEVEIVVYIDDRISRLLFLPNNRDSSFRISKVELLLPESGSGSSAVPTR
jgi:hypothetical protein